MYPDSFLALGIYRFFFMSFINTILDRYLQCYASHHSLPGLYANEKHHNEQMMTTALDTVCLCDNQPRHRAVGSSEVCVYQLCMSCGVRCLCGASCTFVPACCQKRWETMQEYKGRTWMLLSPIEVFLPLSCLVRMGVITTCCRGGAMQLGQLLSNNSSRWRDRSHPLLDRYALLSESFLTR